MNAGERAVLENIIKNLEGYDSLPRREQLEDKIMMAMMLISALLKEGEKAT